MTLTLEITVKGFTSFLKLFMRVVSIIKPFLLILIFKTGSSAVKVDRTEQAIFTFSCKSTIEEETSDKPRVYFLQFCPRIF